MSLCQHLSLSLARRKAGRDQWIPDLRDPIGLSGVCSATTVQRHQIPSSPVFQRLTSAAMRAATNPPMTAHAPTGSPAMNSHVRVKKAVMLQLLDAHEATSSPVLVRASAGAAITPVLRVARIDGLASLVVECNDFTQSRPGRLRGTQDGCPQRHADNIVQCSERNLTFFDGSVA
jgi:hypothetical protein